jgi:ABC-type amino acid transport substrate-binding protein
MGFMFTGVNYYDGIGFLTHKKAGLKSAKELDGATVCIQAGTDTELNVADFFKANKMQYTPVTLIALMNPLRHWTAVVAIRWHLTSLSCTPCALN